MIRRRESSLSIPRRRRRMGEMAQRRSRSESAENLRNLSRKCSFWGDSVMLLRLSGRQSKIDDRRSKIENSASDLRSAFLIFDLRDLCVMLILAETLKH